MPEFRGVWDREAVTAFLREVTIPLRLATRRPDGSLWVVPLWYRYRDGGFECATAADAHVVGFLETDPAVGFDVSTNAVPYRGVRGNGTATLAPDTNKDTLRALLERYLGGTETPLAERLLDEDREEVRIRLEPATVYSWDYTARMRSADE
ncbi:pyridoxamine 5'-phosphate oxidase family protein [Natrononativus amylolyticus]|uniref:pyridoxamine 5'-phosphate oxidase family protein n=1 Tax=Natrononativus amylolyticus TaxID=2963434 RepID=UPI0020CF2203|nr:pyridoxamine 5'-phosphate oxidase family protein [Natrononativus amylolyticus]